MPEEKRKGYGYVQDYRKWQAVCIQYQVGYFRSNLGFEVRKGFRKSRVAQEVNGKLDKIRLGVEECYSKILKNEGAVSSLSLKMPFLGWKADN